jgi:hypothetical protein
LRFGYPNAMEAFDIISKEANALAKKEPNRASKNWYSIKNKYCHS